MNRDVLKFWGVVAAVIGAVAIAGVARRREAPAAAGHSAGRHEASTPAGEMPAPAQRPSLASSLFQPTRGKQLAALEAIRGAEAKCEALSESVSSSWRFAISMDSDVSWWLRVAIYNKDERGEVAAAKAARSAAEEAMRDSGVRSGEAGGPLFDYYTTSQQLCALALSPAGHSLMTFNEETARLGSAASGSEARLKVLLGQ